MDQNKQKYYLVNLMQVLRYQDNAANPALADSKKRMVSFVGLLLRMDSLSNILAWSKSDPSNGAEISIDLVELPRLRLNFEKKLLANGNVQYNCLEQSGMFIANSNRPT